MNSGIIYWRGKKGRMLGLITHTDRYRGPQLALVSLDGYGREKRVELREIIFEKENKNGQNQSFGIS